VTEGSGRAGDPAGGSSGGISVGPWLRRTRQIAYQNAWITLYHDEVIRPDGSPGIYGVVHFRNVAVGVVAIDDQDRVALVTQHRYTLDLPSWEIPEGGASPGEPPVEGAKRELAEETGLAASDWREIARVHVSNSVTDEVALLYLATRLRHGRSQPEASESDLEVSWVDFGEVVAMILDGRITDALTVIAIQRVAIERMRAGATR
jgi:8-oxo-dGTP pyrophosphatase MutT (NUDIX family)